MKPALRYLTTPVKEDLLSRMVFIGGPRQVGKTMLSLQCIAEKPQKENHPAYLNWDDFGHRERILNGHLPSKQPIVILDEVHKFSDWRNLVKGFHDRHKSKISFIVTGSARLDYYRRGGDSLQGRYHYYRLHPISLNELGFDFAPVDPASGTAKEQMEQLLRFGGFPEPLFRGEDRFHRRWQREQSSRVIYEDLRDLENVRDVSKIERLLRHLPKCVGSPLSINSLAKLIGNAHETVEKWIEILERLYLVYRIAPFGAEKIRAVKKEQKLYFWDWSRVDDRGTRFENLVAGQLLKYCHFQEDTQGYEMELRYIRDTDKREVDFVVLRDGSPLFAVECKTGERKVSPPTLYFRERTDIPKFYQVHLGEADYGSEDTTTRVMPFASFCRELNLP